MKKVDVILNVFNKPYQTIATIQSLLKVSGKHIDKIYINFEVGSTGKDIVMQYVDAIYSESIEKCNATFIHEESIRYQYGLLHSDKKHVFISHNDVYYFDDIIGAMINNIANNAGIGLIGQCWNCPLMKADVCDHDRFNVNKTTRDEFIYLLEKYDAPRLRAEHINTFPFPECRLNEFACLIDREISISTISKFGLADGNDTAQRWFVELWHKGYSFINFDINKYCNHGYWAGDAGHPTSLNKIKYDRAEERAKKSLL